MDFIRQAGNKAEVNDGGKIRRLPFSGEGVAPQPGARVNPVRNACCCPGAVPLEPDKGIKGNRVPDPRRVANPTTNTDKDWFVIPSYLRGSLVTTTALSHLKNNNKGILLQMGYESPPPYIQITWLGFNPKTQKYKKIKVQPNSTFYYFCTATFGSLYSLINLGLDGKPLYGIDKIKELQLMNRVNYINEASSKGVTLNHEELLKKTTPRATYILDVPGFDFDYTLTKDIITEPEHQWPIFYKKNHPQSILGNLRILNNPFSHEFVEKQFLLWLQKPKQFPYERLY